jgi:tetratricopeptide (TPR) repeat protein
MTIRVSKSGLWGVVLLLALAGGEPAQAQSPGNPVAESRAHFERAQRLFKVSRYREALEEFKEGYLSKADPVFLYNIAQCHRLLGERADAIMFYRRYLEAAPQSRNRVEVERRIADLETASKIEPASTVPPAAVVTPPPVTMAPPPVAAAAPDAAITGQVPPPDDRPPLYRRWWFWTGAAALVTAGVVTGVLLTRSDSSGCGSGILRCYKL